MKTLEVEIGLMQHFDIRRNVIVPNVSDWSKCLRFEADMLILTKSGFATCIEIKVSKADLRRDLKKHHIAREQLHEHYFKNLKYFYYAVPQFLEDAALEQIPEFAGLLVMKKVFSLRFEKDIYQVEVSRKPKKLFNRKWTDEEQFDLARLGTMRILGLKEKLLK